MKTKKQANTGEAGASVANHTPTPWAPYEMANGSYMILDSGQRMVVLTPPITNTDTRSGSPDTKEGQRANAEFIIRAVNSHEALLKAIEGALREIPVETRLFEGLNLAYKGAKGMGK